MLDVMQHFQCSPGVAASRMTDKGNAELFALAFKEEMRFSPELGWFHWTGHRWEEDKGGVFTMRCAKQVVDYLFKFASRASREDETDDTGKKKPSTNMAGKLLRHAVQSSSRQALDSCIHLARAEADLLVRASQFDTYDDKLIVANGTLNLLTGKLVPSDPREMILRHSDVIFDSDAECPLWLKALDEIFEGNQEMIDFFQRCIGYTLTGSTAERRMFLLHGPTASNGKTIVLEVIRRLLGSYASVGSLKLLVSTGADKEPMHAVAQLHQIRFLSLTELPEKARLNESTIKKLVGRDTLMGRQLYKEQFTFRATHKIWTATNHLPAASQDPALWDRLRVLPFNRRFEGKDDDKDLSDKLGLELPGILAWAVRGCMAWRQEGLKPPTLVQQATEEYRESQDVVGRFIEECCDVPWVPRGESLSLLYRAYTHWQKDDESECLAKDTFAKRLGKLGFKKGKGKGTRIYEGIELVDSIKAELVQLSKEAHENREKSAG